MASFYIDNDAPLRLAALLRAAGHDAVTVRTLGLEAAKDDEHLLTAARRNTTLITHNAKDFALLHRAWLRWSAAWGVVAHHAGILVLPQPTPAERNRGAMDASDLAGLVLELVARGEGWTDELWQWQRGSRWVRPV